jgi:hypothetical protein
MSVFQGEEVRPLEVGYYEELDLDGEEKNGGRMSFVWFGRKNRD